MHISKKLSENKKRRVTVDKLKEHPSYSNLSDEQAEEVIAQLDRFAQILIKQALHEDTGRF